MKKLWAMPDEGYCDGDSGFYYPDSLVPYEKGETFEQVKARVRKSIAKSFGYVDDDPMLDDDVAEMKMVMIITNDTRKTISAGLPRGSVGSDDATYRINRMCKQMCKKAAIKVMRRKK